MITDAERLPFTSSSSKNGKLGGVLADIMPDLDNVQVWQGGRVRRADMEEMFGGDPYAALSEAGLVVDTDHPWSGSETPKRRIRPSLRSTPTGSKSQSSAAT